MNDVNQLLNAKVCEILQETGVNVDPSKSSKTKYHIKALEWRIELWHKGDIIQLLFEAETIQERLETINKSKTIAQLSKQFSLLMSKGNVNGALKLLSNNMSNGILPLNNETLKL